MQGGLRDKYGEGDKKLEEMGGVWVGWLSWSRRVLPKRVEGLERKVWGVDGAIAVVGGETVAQRQGEGARQA